MFKKIQLVESTGVYIRLSMQDLLILLSACMRLCPAVGFGPSTINSAGGRNQWRREPGQALPRNAEIRNNYLDAQCNFRNTQFESSCIELLMIIYILGILPKMFHHR